MWVRLTFSSMDPEQLGEIRAVYNSEEVSGAVREIKGYRFHYLLESADSRGDFVSITAWNTKADADAYEESGTYAEMAAKFEHLLTSDIEVRSYEVREPQSGQTI